MSSVDGTQRAVDLTVAEADLPELVVVVPTRGRPENIEPLLAALRSTSTARTRLVFALDSDDPRVGASIDAAFSVPPELDHRSAGIVADEVGDAGLVLLSRNHDDPFVTVSNNGSLVEALNRSALCFAWMSSASAVAFVRDSAIPRTVGWDDLLLSALSDNGGGIVYPNDLHLGERLPTHVAISTEIVRALGCFAPPHLKHLYIDDVWRLWGEATRRLSYLPDVVIEHMHPVAGKAEWTQSYAEPHTEERRQRDLALLREYVFTRLAQDVRTIGTATAHHSLSAR